MGAYQPQGLTTLTAQPIVDRLFKVIDRFATSVYENYIENINYSESTLNVLPAFIYKPIPNTIRLMINGIAYFEKDGAYSFDRETNKITWKFTKEVGGFDLKEDYIYTAIYSYVEEVKNLTDSFIYDSDFENIFGPLSYKPIENTLKIIIDGIVYPINNFFSYNKETNKIIWEHTSDVGGFDLTSGTSYLIMYDISMKENDLTSLI